MGVSRNSSVKLLLGDKLSDRDAVVCVCACVVLAEAGSEWLRPLPCFVAS